MTTVYFDLETADADQLYVYGDGFCRLAGYAVDDGPVTVTTDMTEVVDVLAKADLVVAHNAIAFDLPALELYHGLDLYTLVHEGRVLDTLLAVRHNDPPYSGKADTRRYGLDAVAKRLLGEGKAASEGESDLKKLAKKHGGYDRIPVDDPAYVAYLRQDVEVLRGIAGCLKVDDYLRREHLVMWRLNHITRYGLRLDVAEAKRRVAAQNERIEEAKLRLAADYGLPTGGKAPQRSKEGAAALEKAFAACGVEPSRTAKGALATGKDALAKLAAEHPDNAKLAELCDVIRAINGERSTAQTLLDRAQSDGRVHPDVDARQAFGRISVTNPGMTVMGKRDRSNVLERSLLLPDEGHVLIALDLAQVDARAIAAHSQDPDYIACFKPVEDYHTQMAVELFGDSSRRSDAKPVTHATTYGMGAKGLAQAAGISDNDAKGLLDKLDRRFPRLARLKKNVRGTAERKHILHNGFGRPMRIGINREYTQAPAAIGQGTARDLMTEGILRLPEWLLPSLRAIVHDEIVLSVPVDRADEAKREALNALQFMWAPSEDATPIPVLADTSEYGEDWLDCYRAELKKWPEVALSHRKKKACDVEGCTWHVTKPLKEAA